MNQQQSKNCVRESRVGNPSRRLLPCFLILNGLIGTLFQPLQRVAAADPARAGGAHPRSFRHSHTAPLTELAARSADRAATAAAVSAASRAQTVTAASVTAAAAGTT